MIMSSGEALRARGWSCLTEDSHEQPSAGELPPRRSQSPAGAPRRASPLTAPDDPPSDHHDDHDGAPDDDFSCDGSYDSGQFGDNDEGDGDGGQFADAPEDGDDDRGKELKGYPGEKGGAASEPRRPSLAASPRGSGADRLAAARSRLSAWSARLLDPSRPRLVEPPRTIPLNDEFLQAFGRRVQQDDARLGRADRSAVDPSIPDRDDDGGGDDDDEPGQQEKSSPAAQQQQAPETKNPASGRKVKIWNLRYTTTERTLREACERFGDVEEVNLVMDDAAGGGGSGSGSALNKGRAYVTFADPDAAGACLEGLDSLDGRALRVVLAGADPSGPGSARARGGGGGGGWGAPRARYWLVDLATKCYRCGQVGHVERDCPNEAAPKPCPLCARTDHELRDCPSRTTCFACGLVGHVSRDCPARGRGAAAVARAVCTLCGQSGHHRRQCRLPDTELLRRQRGDAASATCLACRRPGHYCCKDSKWFHGLDTLTCWNCGRVGHDGTRCDRPRLEVVGRLPENSHVAAHEIERAATYETAEEHFAELALLQEQQRQKSQDQQRRPGHRDSSRDNGGRRDGGASGGFDDDARRRAKSLPPQRHNSQYRGSGGDTSARDGRGQQRENGPRYDPERGQQQRVVGGGGGGSYYYDQDRQANGARYPGDPRRGNNGENGSGGGGGSESRRSKSPAENLQRGKRPRWR